MFGQFKKGQDFKTDYRLERLPGETNENQLT